jgi:Xaa-Pro dipeptidase
MTYDIKNDVLTLFLPRFEPRSVIYNGRGSTPAEALDKYDIDRALYIDDLNAFMSHWFDLHQGQLYLLHAWQAPHTPLSAIIDHTSLLPAMNHVRAIKDDYEIQQIKQANDISSQAHREVLASILNFKNESQVEGLFLDVCISKLAKRQAYAPIAGSGQNAGTLHYADNNEDFADRQLMVLDAGCEWQLYASDITRTFPLANNWPSQESKEIYQLVQRMQETCIDGLAPGVRYLDLHILAHQIAIDGLLTLGILHNGTKEEIYKAGTSRAFFMHGLGHHMGLDVHDPGQAELMSFDQRQVAKV